MNFQAIVAQFGPYFAIPRDTTFWTVINSPALVAAITGLLAILINRRVERLAEQTEDAQKTADLAEQLNQNDDKPVAQPLPSSSVPLQPAGEPEDFYTEAAALMDRFKRYVDRAIEKAPDGRNKRRYKNLGKRDYRVPIVALAEDHNLTEGEKGDLMLAFETWRPFQTHQQPTPKPVLSQLKRISDRLKA
ncbi:MAG: hypothetical protein QM759_01400 [Terricaulis sp.]